MTLTQIDNLTTQHDKSLFRQSSSIEILSSFENIVMPRKVVPPGRPKGSATTTVIGTQRKTTKRKHSDIGLSEDVSTSKKQFAKINHDEQATIIQWLANLESVDTVKRKVTIQNIIDDPNVFNRLRNDMIFLGSLKKYLDVKCFEFLKNKVVKLHEKPWNCSYCNLILI